MHAQWGSIAMPPLNSLGTHDKFDTFVMNLPSEHKHSDAPIHFSFDDLDRRMAANQKKADHHGVPTSKPPVYQYPKEEAVEARPYEATHVAAAPA